MRSTLSKSLLVPLVLVAALSLGAISQGSGEADQAPPTATSQDLTAPFDLEPEATPAAVVPLPCGQWYSVHDFSQSLVDDCDTATRADFDRVRRRAIARAAASGTTLCQNLGCTHTLSGHTPSTDCSCENRVIYCEAIVDVFCA
jgi:hypothetical protein